LLFHSFLGYYFFFFLVPLVPCNPFLEAYFINSSCSNLSQMWSAGVLMFDYLLSLFSAQFLDSKELFV